MKINDWLATAQAELDAADIATARLDALVLLEDCLVRDRAFILAHSDGELTDEQLEVLASQLARRKHHEPLAYIRGKTEFYGRDFLVNSHVLEPRPESEAIIDCLKQLAPAEAVIADIGTGSGALAITAKLELPASKVLAVDVDPKCLEVARQNATRHAVELQFMSGSLLEPLKDARPDILLCNLPYVPDDFQINKAATHEPDLALFGGPDGLDLYRQLFKQTEGFTAPPLVIAESMPSQHAALDIIARQHGYEQQQTDGFIQVFAASR